MNGSVTGSSDDCEPNDVESDVVVPDDCEPDEDE
jgi:hypothetical protein